MSLLRNVYVDPFRGIRARPGSDMLTDADENNTFIPFFHGTSPVRMLLLAFGASSDALDITGTRLSSFSLPARWSTTPRAEIGWAQQSDTAVLCHGDHPPIFLRLIDNGVRISVTEMRTIETQPDRGPARRLVPFEDFFPQSTTFTMNAEGRNTDFSVIASADTFTESFAAMPVLVGDASLTVTEVVDARNLKLRLTGGTVALPQNGLIRLLTPIFSDVRGWPQVATFHQGRLVLGGSESNPDWIFLSKSGDFEQFSPHTGLSDDPIVLPLPQSSGERVRTLTSHNELYVTGGDSVWVLRNPRLTALDLDIHKLRIPGEENKDSKARFPAPHRDGLLLIRHKDLLLIKRGQDSGTFVVERPLIHCAHLLSSPLVKVQLWESENLVLLLRRDGKILAGTIDNLYGHNAWSLWESDGPFLDLFDTQDSMNAVVKRNDRVCLLERFNTQHTIDCSHDIDHLYFNKGVREMPKALVFHPAARLFEMETTHNTPVSVRENFQRSLPDNLEDNRDLGRVWRGGFPYTARIRPIPGHLSSRNVSRPSDRIRIDQITLRFNHSSNFHVRVLSPRGVISRTAHADSTQGAEPFSGELPIQVGIWRSDNGQPIWELEKTLPGPLYLESFAHFLSLSLQR